MQSVKIVAMVLEQWLEQTQQQFEQHQLSFGHGTDNAWDEAVQLACFVLQLPIDVDRSVLAQPLTETQSVELDTLAQRRIKEKIPAAYLIGQAWYWGHAYYVTPDTLIPRSPIGEWTAKRFEPFLSQAPKRILDLCTGSGCIGLQAAQMFPEASVDLVDISPAALAVAQKNVARYQLQERVRAIESDLFASLGDKKYDLILSNPPYVSQQEIDQLPAEYLHEPYKLALYADEEGLALIREILAKLKQYLAPGGIAVFDFGYTADKVVQEFSDYDWLWLDLEHGGYGILLVSGE